MMHTLQHPKQMHHSDVHGPKNANTQAIKRYVKTGKYDFMPGVDEKDYESETDLKEALQRTNKIH